MDREFTPFYKLDDEKNVVPVNDMVEWSDWLHTANRRVRIDEIGDTTVSTVFTGIDTFSMFGGKPKLFDTAVFKGDHELEIYCIKTSTWKEAVECHELTLSKVKGTLN